MVSGPDAAPAVQATDGRVYDRGHLFAKGNSSSGEVTLGVSAASKIWSNRSSHIPDFIAWCREHAQSIATGILRPTGSSIDNLSAGVHLDTLPSGIVAALWHQGVYRDPPDVIDADGVVLGTLLDADLRVSDSIEGSVRLHISFEEAEWSGAFSLEGSDLVTHVGGVNFSVVVGSKNIPIEAYLAHRQPVFFTDKFAAIVGPTNLP